jgi:Rrf2 family protein
MRSDYGAHAVIELARRYGQGPVQCAEIASSQKIPEAYLDQLLSGLRRVGIVRSVRGPHGGHELARDPRQLTLGDVVTALEGPVVPHEFVHSPSSDAEGTNWWAACAVRNAWLEAAEASQRILDRTTIQDLLEQQLQIRAHRGELPLSGMPSGDNALPDHEPLVLAADPAPRPLTRTSSGDNL